MEEIMRVAVLFGVFFVISMGLMAVNLYEKMPYHFHGQNVAQY